MANIVFDETYCKGCSLCINFCTKQVLAMSKKTNAKGYSIPTITEPEKCSECGICAMMCPELAITIEEGAK